MKHELYKIMRDVKTEGVYRGVLVTKIIGGYMCLGQKAKDQKEVDKIIDTSLTNLQNTIK